LLSFQLSRSATRTGERGELLTLDAQDRGQWNRDLISDGLGALARARVGCDRPPLLLQAELAACHATAASFDATPWDAIVALYDELLQQQDTPIVALNRAVAVAKAHGPRTALPLLDQLTEDPALRASHRVWAVRADLHRQLEDTRAAIADYDRALQLAGNDAERRYLIAVPMTSSNTSPTARTTANGALASSRSSGSANPPAKAPATGRSWPGPAGAASTATTRSPPSTRPVAWSSSSPQDPRGQPESSS
jgi:predicted RNA polymerase sigma factor